ncbi:MAG: PPC domain-containing protein [Deltaproteobacteria bacterium]|nr:PPC domain-containing protein [Deltaproteobacteria bacterium]
MKEASASDDARARVARLLASYCVRPMPGRAGPRRTIGAALALGVALLASIGCDPSPGLTVLKPNDATVAVNETLRLPIGASNPDGTPLSWSFRSDVPDIERVARISGTSMGAEFVWTPLASQLGTHVVTFVAEGDGETSSASATIDVVTSADSAPTFLQPGSGRSYDVSITPCIDVDVEVRDDDDLVIDIRQRPPDIVGGRLDLTGDKTALFHWCPSDDQLAASERYTLRLEADDYTHAPVPHDFVMVLRRQTAPGCPGTAPSIAVVSPAPGARVTSGAAFEVLADVQDDVGVRDAPVLHWSLTPPAAPDSPDLSTFELVPFAPVEGNLWSAHVSLPIEAGSEATVHYVIEATDNDDVTGTACDHRTQTAVGTFVAVATGGGGTQPPCAPCLSDAECADGVCAATTATGITGCGPATLDCGGSMCVDDDIVDNDTFGRAEPLPFGATAATVCPGDDDYWSFLVFDRERLTATLTLDPGTGDLDLQLLDEAGVVVRTSAGTGSTETIEHDVVEGGAYVLRVYGFLDASGGYLIDATTAPLP